MSCPFMKTICLPNVTVIGPVTDTLKKYSKCPVIYENVSDIYQKTEVYYKEMDLTMFDKKYVVPNR